jgi:uncharacterized membrane protein
MANWAIAFVGTSAVFLLLDFIWLSQAAPMLYRPALGPLMAERINFGAAAVFYALYALGIVILAVRPALRDHSAFSSVLNGGILGLVAYGTYDLTNLATLQGWPLKITLIDMVWGSLVSAAAAFAGFWVASLTKP